MVTDHLKEHSSLMNMEAFWWLFALRGGFAVLFAGVLCYSGSLFGTIFFDPVMLVILGVLLGFYVLGNGVLLGVGGVVAFEHRIHIWRLLLCESVFALLLGAYIGFSLMLSKEVLALLAGIHACGIGLFQFALALKLRHEKPFVFLLSVSSVVSLSVGAGFLLHRSEELGVVTHWLSAYELFFGVVVLLLALALRKRHLAAISLVIAQPAVLHP